MVQYKCQTCGQSFTQSADAWQWHRLMEHPSMGLPFHRVDPQNLSPFVRRALARELPAKEVAR